MGKISIHHFCNKICCQTSMFINSRMATIEKYRDVQVYSGKMSRYSVIFRLIPWYSGIFRHIPLYSVIFRDIPAFRVFTTPTIYVGLNILVQWWWKRTTVFSINIINTIVVEFLYSADVLQKFHANTLRRWCANIVTKGEVTPIRRRRYNSTPDILGKVYMESTLVVHKLPSLMPSNRGETGDDNTTTCARISFKFPRKSCFFLRRSDDFSTAKRWFSTEWHFISTEKCHISTEIDNTFYGTASNFYGKTLRLYRKILNFHGKSLHLYGKQAIFYGTSIIFYGRCMSLMGHRKIQAIKLHS
jgi:hypothetical protein